MQLAISTDAPIEWHPAQARLAVVSADGLSIVEPAAPAPGVVVDAARLGASLPHAMAWAPSGDAIAIGGDGVRVFGVNGETRWHRAIDVIDTLRWAPNGESIACLGDDVVVCDARTGEERWRHAKRRDEARWIDRTFTEVRALDAYVDAPQDAVWSPDSQLLAVRYDDRSVEILASADGAHVAQGAAPSRDRLAWSSDGETVAIVGSQRLARHALEGVWGDRWVSSDARFAAAEARYPNLHVRRDGASILVHRGPANLQAGAWSLDGTLAIACDDGVLRRLAPERDTLERWTEIDRRVRWLAWSADGAWLAARGGDTLTLIAR